MNLSLFNRLQGSLYGSLLSLNTQDSPSSPPRNFNCLLETTQVLAQTGDFSLEQWDAIARKNPDNASGFLRLIPIVLFWHDYPTALQSLLQCLTDKGYLTHEDALALQTWSQILTSVLRERFHPDLDFLAQVQDSYLESSLLTIKQAIQQRLCLNEVIQSLGNSALSSAIWLSLYCFLDTPTHLVLTLKRANQCPNPLVLPFTGALAGAYHGLTGIPLAWQLSIETAFTQYPLSEICHSFWQQWSGSLTQLPSSSITVLASPRVIQRRLSIPLISQSEYLP